MKKAEDLKTKIASILTPKNLAWGLLAVYLLSLIPLFVIGFYDYPSADDFSEAVEAHRAFVATHSVFAAFGAAVKRAVGDYFSWMGYFTCNFFMAFSPTAFGGRAYVITPFLMIGSLSAGTVVFFRFLLCRIFGAGRHEADCVSLLVLLVTVQRMTGRVEAFYWYLGAVNYMFLHGICLLFYGLLIGCAFERKDGKAPAGFLIAACFIGFLTGGGNQMTALNAAIVLFFAAAGLFLTKRASSFRSLFIPMGFFYLGFLLNVFAPGNSVRAAGQNGMGPLKAVMVSFYYCLDYCFGQWSGWPVLLLVVLLVPIFWKIFEKTEFTFPLPGIAAGLGFCLTSAMMTPPLFAIGNIEAGRLRSVTYAVFVLTTALVTGYCTGWAEAKIRKNGRAEAGEERKGFSGNGALLLAGGILFALFASALCVIPEPRYFSASSAITDLRDGSASLYGAAMEERNALYMSGQEDVTVDPLPTEPELLYFSDISTDPGYWENGALCRYFGLGSVVKREKTDG